MDRVCPSCGHDLIAEDAPRASGDPMGETCPACGEALAPLAEMPLAQDPVDLRQIVQESLSQQGAQAPAEDIGPPSHVRRIDELRAEIEAEIGSILDLDAPPSAARSTPPMVRSTPPTAVDRSSPAQPREPLRRLEPESEPSPPQGDGEIEPDWKPAAAELESLVKAELYSRRPASSDAPDLLIKPPDLKPAPQKRDPEPLPAFDDDMPSTSLPLPPTPDAGRAAAVAAALIDNPDTESSMVGLKPVVVPPSKGFHLTDIAAVFLIVLAVLSFVGTIAVMFLVNRGEGPAPAAAAAPVAPVKASPRTVPAETSPAPAPVAHAPALPAASPAAAHLPVTRPEPAAPATPPDEIASKPAAPPRPKHPKGCDPLLFPDPASCPTRPPPDRAEVLDLFNDHREQIQRCMDDHADLAQDAPNQQIKARFFIAPTGRTSQVKILDEDIAKTALGRCLVRQVRSWRVEAFAGSPIGPITFPFPVGAR